MNSLRIASVAAVAALFVAGLAQTDDGLLAGFRNVPTSARMRFYWRIFGPALKRSEIDYQLQLLKDAGVGGVMAYFMYPFALDDPANGVVNRKFDSPEFLADFGYAARKAHELGLKFGVCGSTGWPYGGAKVTLADSAHMIRHETVSAGAKAELKEGESAIAVSQGGRVVPASRIDPRLPYEVYIVGPTYQTTKRPAYGNEGYVLDHLNPEAVRRYLDSTVKPMIDAAPGMFDGLFSDSLEVYRANWTASLPAEFRRRRGYDIVQRLPDLFDEHAPDFHSLRFDLWRTIAEMMETNYAGTIDAWAKPLGIGLEMQAYGTPPCPMTTVEHMSIPSSEHYEWKGFSVSRYVAAACHLAGKKAVGSEAWTWAGLPNRLADTLSDLKLVGNMEFLGGVNDITGVDFAYSPRSVGSPGWQPYYGPTLNQNNPLWHFMPEFAAYNNRCCWMLRQGRPVADVALYLPVEDALAGAGMDGELLDFALRDHFVTGQPTSEFGLKNALKLHSDLLHGLMRARFDFDGVDFWAMERWMRVEDGELRAGDGRYRAIVLPNLTGIQLASMRKIVDFVKAGGSVVAVRRVPTLAYGLNSAGDTPKIQELVKQMFTPAERDPYSIHAYGKGKVAYVRRDADLGPTLQTMIGADVSLSPDQPDVGFVHRQTKDHDLYFLVNTGDRPVAFGLRRNKAGDQAETWDPAIGEVRTMRSASGDRFDVSLPARGSTFLVFGKPSPGALPRLSTPTSRSEEIVAGPWEVSFDGPDAPASRTVDSLTNWTLWPGSKYFSGLATYRTSFDWKGGESARVVLSIDEVREAAEVWVNGARAGSIWAPPNEVEIGKLLRPGKNELRLVVANLLVNRFIGLPRPDMGPLRKQFGNRFQAPEEHDLMKEPAPSGLIGTVRIVTFR